MKNRALALVCVVVLAIIGACNRSSPTPAAAAPAAASGAKSCCSDPSTEALDPLAADASAKKKRLRGLAAEGKKKRHVFLSTIELEDEKKRLQGYVASGDPARQVLPKSALAELMMNAGDLDGAVRELEDAIALFPKAKVYPPPLLDAMEFMLGMTWFRLAEKRNCVAHHTQESCIFPLQGGAIHIDPLGASNAKKIFEALVERAPEYREAEWLLNVAHMALGTWPDGVPVKHRLTPEMIAPEAPFAHFVDVAAEKNINRHTRAGFGLLEDFDGDGRLDVMSGSFDPAILVKFFHGTSTGAYEDKTRAAGLADEVGGAALVRGDIDGDGMMDVLVLRGTGVGQDGAWPCSLLHQTAPGKFEDIAETAGLTVEAPSKTAAFADIDLDGDLDLFIGYETTSDLTQKRIFESRLYRNDGGLRFTDVTSAAGIRNDRYCVGAIFGDVDGDGFADLFLSNRFAANRLYKNSGDGTFTDITATAGVAAPDASTAALFFDFDQDGDLDLFVASHDDVMHGRSVAEYYFTKKIVGGTSKLYENDGHGRFRECGAEKGLLRPDYVLSASAADLDNDGFPDLYLGTGSDEMAGLWPNVLLKNDGGVRFLDVTRAAGLGHLQKTNAIAFGDIDQDGDLDIFLKMGGTQIDDAFGDVLFENPSAKASWIALDLRGTRSNRFAVGAQIRIRSRSASGTHTHYATAGTLGSTDGSPHTVHIGLGAATTIEEIEIHWPNIGRTTTLLKDVAINRTLTITEGK